MAEARWPLVEELYHGALGAPAGERGEWLRRACGDDDSLRQEVERLLRYDALGAEFLEQSALAVEAAAMASDPPGHLAGRRLGGYEVRTFIGAGGMGEVYRATDVRLRRDVALKVFEHTVSPAAIRRLDAEARAASVLSHPNIVTIYGVGEEGDAAFIAMELVQGRTLRELVADGPCPPAEAIEIAVQLADAIAAAHAAGIVHRDLKPENVMVSADGRVKVLDFGIAQLQDEWYGADGALMGTVGYMSPEQAARREVGPASDQFSFGVICAELLTGRHPFAGDATLTFSGPLGAVIERCLATDPRDRYPTSADLAATVRQVRDDGTRVAAGAGLTRRHALRLAGIGAAAIVAGGLGRWLWTGAAPTALAVLPFGNPLGDENTEYLCDGVAETLIRQLGSLASIRVTARATAFTFKGSKEDPRRIGRQLGVDAVLTGTVVRRGGRLLVSTELVDSSSGARLWGAEFQRPSLDVLAVQADIAEAIIREGIHVRVTEADRRRLAALLPADPTAYELFLGGVHHLRMATEDDYLAARDLLTAAVARDGGFALALVTLASTYSVMAVDGYAAPSESWPEADANIARALQIDDGLPDAHAEAAASAFFYRWNWPEAERRWTMALGSPRGEVQSELLTAYALQTWAAVGPEAALTIARTARQVDALSAQAALREADLLAALDRMGDAVTVYDKVIRDAPNDPRAYFGLADVRRRQGRFDDALAALRRAHGAAGDESLAPLLDRARGEAGYADVVHATVRRQLAQLQQREAEGGYVSALDFARVHAQLGDAPEALRQLDAAVDERAAGLALLGIDPAWNATRSAPRFRAVLDHVGIRGRG